MTPMSLSRAKNAMRRALSDLTDPLPSREGQLAMRRHFEDRCAYCSASAGLREGHIDHADKNGGNSIGNLILACGKCNGDEKREAHWEEFLRKKCGEDRAALEERQRRIRAWMDAHPRTPGPSTPELVEAIASAHLAIESFAAAYSRVRVAVVAAKKTR